MNYDFSKGTLETASGINYNLDWCIAGMNKFDRNRQSKEYKIFKSVFQKIVRQASNEVWADKNNN